MLEVYRTFVEDFLAIPLVYGRKSAAERFPGAEETYTIEALMPDGRALQCGTSHYPTARTSRERSKSVSLDENNQLQHPHQTSWGVSTRLLGAIVMTHGDEQGLRMPPAVASTQVVIVPIWRKADEGERVLPAARLIFEALEKAGLRVRLDQREGFTPGFKFNDWEMRGVPLRIEIGPRDVASGEIVLARRDVFGQAGKSKAAISEVAARATSLLDEIQKSLFAQAKAVTEANTQTFDNYEKLRAHMKVKVAAVSRTSTGVGIRLARRKFARRPAQTCRAIPLGQESGPGLYCLRRECPGTRFLCQGVLSSGRLDFHLRSSARCTIISLSFICCQNGCLNLSAN